MSTRQISVITFIAFSAILCAAACINVSNSSKPDKELIGTVWDLQSFEETGGTTTPVGSQGITLVFSKNGSIIEGKSYTIQGETIPGNAYGGVYGIEKDRGIVIDSLWSTKVGLPAGSRYNEYLEALDNASAYEIDGNKLRIYYFSKSKVLNFLAKE